MFCSEKKTSKTTRSSSETSKGLKNCNSENRDGQSQNNILFRGKCNYKVQLVLIPKYGRNFSQKNTLSESARFFSKSKILFRGGEIKQTESIKCFTLSFVSRKEKEDLHLLIYKSIHSLMV